MNYAQVGEFQSGVVLKRSTVHLNGNILFKKLNIRKSIIAKNEKIQAIMPIKS